MKRVAILTAETLSQRSFIWDVGTYNYRARISTEAENTVEQLEDGLYIEAAPLPTESDSSPQEPQYVNKMARVNFINNKANYGDLRFEILTVLGEGLVVSVKSSKNIELNVYADEGYYQPTILGPEPMEIHITKGLRMAYIFQNQLVVIDLAAILPYDDNGKINGFLDVVINVPLMAFNSDVIVEVPEQT